MIPNHFQEFASKVFTIYSDAELFIINKLSNSLYSDINLSNWKYRKLSEINAVKKVFRSYLNNLSKERKKLLYDGNMKAYRYAYDSFISELMKTKFDGKLLPPSLRRVMKLIEESNSKLDYVDRLIFRKANDVYKDVVVHASELVATGSITLRDAVRLELNDFADRGITSFVDKSGSKWSLPIYAEMATITALNRATMVSYVDSMQEYGYDLAYVSSHGDSCPLCRQWEGVIVSVSGKDSRYPSLNDAISSGLYHPNCKHDISTYFDGISKPVKYDVIESEKNYQERSRQRYYERQIRKWKRRMLVSASAEEESKAFDRVQLYRLKIREARQDTKLTRKYYREGGAIKLSDKAKKFRYKRP